MRSPPQLWSPKLKNLSTLARHTKFSRKISITESINLQYDKIWWYQNGGPSIKSSKIQTFQPFKLDT